MFGPDRSALRRVYLEAWHKHRERQPLEPLERLIAEVVALHPEYQPLLEAPEAVLEQDFDPQSDGDNPFLHLGLHLALREQLAIDRPPGIVALHRKLCLATGNPHQSEHALMECLAETIRQAQRAQRPPDESDFLACVQARLSLFSPAAK